MPLIPLLFLCPRVPWPLNTGAKIRTSALLSRLKEAFEVHYAGLIEPGCKLRDAQRYLDGCASIHLFPERADGLAGKAWLALRSLVNPRPVTILKYRLPELAAHARRWMESHPRAIVHADHLHMSPYLGMGPAAMRVIDEHNVECMIIERMADRHRRKLTYPYLRLQAGRMRDFEAAMARRADLILSVSEVDRAELARLAPQARIEVIPNGVDLEYYCPGPARAAPIPGRLVFTGSMNWPPNQDAMKFFTREVLPLLGRRFERRPPWTLDIVGHAPPPSVRALASSAVRVTGTVPDVRPYLNEAMICVVPMRIGGGSRLKILEAFAMGVPVVSTTVGCEGLGVGHEEQILIADAPGEFAQAVDRLAGDPEFRDGLVRRAMRHAQDHFGWPAIGRKLVDLYERVYQANSMGSQ